MSHPIPSACKLPSFTWQISTHLSRLSSDITSTAVFPGSPRRGILPPGFLARLLIYTISRTFPWSLCVYLFIYYTTVFESSAPVILPHSVCAWHTVHSINDHEWILKPVCWSSCLSATGSNVISWICNSFYIMKRKYRQDPTYMHFFRKMEYNPGAQWWSVYCYFNEDHVLRNQ